MGHRHVSNRGKIRLAQRSWDRPSPDASDPKVVKGCLGKSGQYSTKQIAREAARAATKRHGVKFTVYRCKVGCRLFHLTTTPRRQVATVEPVEPEIVVPVARPEFAPITTSLAGSEVKRLVRRTG